MSQSLSSQLPVQETEAAVLEQKHFPAGAWSEAAACGSMEAAVRGSRNDSNRNDYNAATD